MSRPHDADPGARPSGRTRSTSALAVLALVFAFVFAPLGIILGHLARGRIQRTGQPGARLATAGLALGYIITVSVATTVITVAALIARQHVHG